MNVYAKLLFAVLLTGLPLAGVWISGYDLSTYLEFPPTTRYVEHAAFSWPIFIGLAILILAVMVPFLFCVIRSNLARSRPSPTQANGVAEGLDLDSPAVAEGHDRGLPWWGWTALVLNLTSWLLAWSRLEWMQPLQRYTYNPLWLTYIVIINALTYRRTGRCLLTHETSFFLKLFPLSAAFWWFFEYLNRFVQNWYYTEGANVGAWHYIIAATLSFSTVLPAILSTEEWLRSHPRCYAGLDRTTSQSPPAEKSLRVFCAFSWPIKPRRHVTTFVLLTLLTSATGLFLIGRFPDYLFPLLWVAPLLHLLALNHLAGGPSFFPELRHRDVSRLYRFALAGLICGFFWELWNAFSLAKWIYTVPYVHRFQLFEMPLLGYAGYLPFGLECAVIANLIHRKNVS